MQLLDNLGWKAMSLVLAVLLWFVIAGEKTSEMGISVPLELRNFPTDLEITGDPVNSVEVRLRAAPGIIHRLGPGEISAQLDLAGAREGERIIHVTEDSVRVPFGVKVVKVTPSILTLNFEKTIEKVVPVRPRILGYPAPGYEVGAITSHPSEARMAGPRSRVEDVDSAFTEPVSVASADSNVHKSVNIGLEDPLLRIQGDPRVQVTVEVRSVQDKRAFLGVPVTVRGGSLEPTPASVKVILVGPAAALKMIPLSSLRAFVDSSQADAEKRARVSIALDPGPPGVRVDHVEPPAVVLHATRVPR